MHLDAPSIHDPAETAMREEITVTARLTYDCNAEASLDLQTALIYGDMHRLLKADPATRVECVSIAAAYSASESETYTTNASDLSERQAMRLHTALAGTVYPDDQDDPKAILRNALCDLRHYADQHGLNFTAEDKEAHGIYRAEKMS